MEPLDEKRKQEEPLSCKANRRGVEKGGVRSSREGPLSPGGDQRRHVQPLEGEVRGFEVNETRRLRQVEDGIRAAEEDRGAAGAKP